MLVTICFRDLLSGQELALAKGSEALKASCSTRSGAGAQPCEEMAPACSAAEAQSFFCGKGEDLLALETFSGGPCFSRGAALGPFQMSLPSPAMLGLISCRIWPVRVALGEQSPSAAGLLFLIRTGSSADGHLLEFPCLHSLQPPEDVSALSVDLQLELLGFQLLRSQTSPELHSG